MSDSVRIDLTRNEILTPIPTIGVECDGRPDRDVALRAIGVPGIDGAVKAGRSRGQFHWTPLDPMPPGRYQLVVEDLVDADGQVVAEGVTVPFEVIETRAELSARLRIESMTRIAVEEDGVRRVRRKERPEGRFIEVFKAEDRRSGKPKELAFDQDGAPVDVQEVLSELEQARAKRFGKIHPTLAETMESQADPVLVDVWLSVSEPEPSPADRPLSAGDVGRVAKRALAQRGDLQEQVRELAGRIGESAEIVRVDPLAPVVTISASADQVRRLAESEDVAWLFLHEVEGFDDLTSSIAIARSNSVHDTGEGGSGVKVAVWESGPTSTANLVITDRFTNNPSTSNHSQNVHAIIRNEEDGTPNGHAPACSLHSANSMNRDALTWAVEEKQCTVINQSFHRWSEPRTGTLSSDDLYGDWLALHWPYPFIVHAAGNYWATDSDNINPPSSEFVNHKGYNTINAGNHNDSASAMSSTSVFRNPTTLFGDRELPEICANGTSVTADGITMSGTSMASPAVAGIAAQLQGTDATLEHWPEGCRAILLAGAARNVQDETWWEDVIDGTDAADGSGAANAWESRQIALQRRWRDAPATQFGWDIGRLVPADFDEGRRLSTFAYQVKVPANNPCFQLAMRWRVKVALAYTSTVSMSGSATYGSSLGVDLDLKVFDENGAQVGYSGSWDNSYEIAEFDAKPGATYTIRIRRWSGTDGTWYGLAWRASGSLLLLPGRVIVGP